MNNIDLKQKAFQLVQQQQFSQALETCKRYCKKAKKDAEGFFLLGSIYGALEDMPNAITAFMKSAKINPHSPEIFYNLGVAQQKNGDLAEAAKSFKKAINIKPDFFEASFNLAEALRESGQPDKAYDQYIASSKINSQYAPLHMNIGNLLREKGKNDDAIQSYKKSIEIAPDYEEVYVNLGVAYAQIDNLDLAESSYKKALKLNPVHARAYLMYGLLQHKKGELEEAVSMLNRSIELDPSNSLAHYNLGIILRKKEQFDLAEVAFIKAINLNPAYIDAYIGLANVQRDIGAIDKAMDTMKLCLDYKPANAEFYNEYGNLLGARGNHTDAIVQHKAAVELEPASASAHMGLGFGYLNMNEYDSALEEFILSESLADDNTYKLNAISGRAIIYDRRRDYEKAYSLIKPYINDNINPRIALALGALSSKIDMNDYAIQMIEKALNNPDTILEHKIELNFQLGKIYDKLGRFDQAFEHYKAGNEYFRKSNKNMVERYSTRHDADLFKSIEDTFTKSHFENAKYSICDTDLPIFIVGMPRSGTTLTESILSTHSNIQGAGELPYIAEIRKKIESASGKLFTEVINELSQQELNNFAEYYLSKLDSPDRNIKRIIDKMPHNFITLGIIAQVLPNAKVIHIQRNPIDNCLSIFFQRFNVTHTYASSLKDLGTYYRAYLDLMKHWNEVLPISILNIKYDDLVAKQEEVTRQLIEYCGLPWDENCLAFHKSKRDVNTPSYDQVNQPMYSKSSGRWRNYAIYIDELVQTLENNGSIADFENNYLLAD